MFKYNPTLIWDTSSRELLTKPGGGPYVIVLNHQHSIDIFFLWEIWPVLRRVTTLAKKALLYAGPFGAACYLVGTVFVDRSRGPEARRKLYEAVRKAKAEDTHVCIFPEGTRHHSATEKELLPFKSGAFSAAIAAQMPVLPIVISHYKVRTYRNNKRKWPL